MAKPKAITICLNVFLFNVRFTFLVNLFVGIRILFGRMSSKDSARVVIGTLRKQILYLD